ncbi:hypothetical protein [Streptomyces termitum]|uniref:hypothetical protein n=1 Tax=Streptomyces termitum TaxID=67368 RepID=UPI0033B7DA5E
MRAGYARRLRSRTRLVLGVGVQTQVPPCGGRRGQHLAKLRVHLGESGGKGLDGDQDVVGRRRTPGRPARSVSLMPCTTPHPRPWDTAAGWLAEADVADGRLRGRLSERTLPLGGLL